MAEEQEQGPFRGAALKAALQERRMSLTQLSEVTGISLGYLSTLSTSKQRNPSVGVVIKLGEALHRPIQDFLEASILTPELGTGTELHYLALRVHQFLNDPSISDSSKRFFRQSVTDMIDFLKEGSETLS